MALIHLSTLITAGLIPAGASAVWSWIVTFDWGSFPDYLAGLGAVAALIWARKAAKAAKAANERQDKQLQILIDDKRQQEEEARRTQAELVSAWFYVQESARYYRPEIVIRNASQAPVSAIVVTVRTSLFADDGWVTLVVGRSIVPPTDGKNLRIAVNSPVIEQVIPLLNTQSVTLAFTDASGSHWERDQDGNLVRFEEKNLWWGPQKSTHVYIQPYPEDVNRQTIDMLTRVDVDKDHKGDPVRISLRRK